MRWPGTPANFDLHYSCIVHNNAKLQGKIIKFVAVVLLEGAAQVRQQNEC